jgi:hypothetical protein
MGIVRVLKPGLFIYECVRILILAAFVAMQPLLSAVLLATDLADFPIMVFAAPNALFPLMALFLWLNTSRYRAYLPLFAAGKCINIISLLGWSILVQSSTMIRAFPGIVQALAELMLLSGDLLALAAVILIIRDTRKITEAQASEVK